MRKARRPQPKLFRANVFKAASRRHLKDAECLHKAGRYSGAIYLCGYVLECRLKYCVCEQRGASHLEQGEAKGVGHDLFGLLDKAGLRTKLVGNDDFWVAFQNVTGKWSTEMRYSGAEGTAAESERFLQDTRDLCQWLEMELKL